MELDSRQQSILERLKDVAEDLGRSPSQIDIREETEEFSTEYEIRKHFDSFNKAKKLAGLTVDIYSNEIERPIERDSDLAYFLGVLAGDGCIHNTVDDCKAVTLTAKDAEMVEEFENIGEEKFGVSPIRNKQYTNGREYYRVNFLSSEMARWLGDWSHESWAKTLRSDYEWVIADHPDSFLSGIFDAEGTNTTAMKIYCQNRCGSSIISDCLTILGVKHTMDSKGVRISDNDQEEFLELSNPRIERKMEVA
jgi:hypothetical protein